MFGPKKPVGETSRSRFLPVGAPLDLDASDVPVGETSRSRCGAYLEDIEMSAVVCNRQITNISGAGAPELQAARTLAL